MPGEISIYVHVLVGRDEELRLIEHMLARGSRAGVVLMGASGVGKTRLARAAAHGYAQSGARWVWAAGTRSAQSVPFGAFAGLLGAVGELGHDRVEVMMAVRRAVLASVGQGGLLVVDDADLLDQASAAVVHSLAITGEAALIVTVRSGTPSPDAVTALWKDGLLECVQLQPLARGEVGELLVALLRGEVDAGARERVWEATRGNPLFCSELVRAAVATGVLSHHSGEWRWRGALPGTGRLWDLIEARLSDLDARELAALEVIALADGADAALLERVVDPAARVSLVRRALVEESPVEDGSVLRLAHPLYGEALRARLPADRRRELCGLLAEAAELAGLALGPDLLRVAGWRLEAGEGLHPDLLIAAARRAQAAFDPGMAERCARAAVAAGGGSEAERALAVALGALGRGEESEEIFRRLERAAESDAERAVLAAAHGEMMMLNGLRAADAAAVARRAVSTLEPGTLRDELHAFEAAWGWLSGEARPADRRDEWSRIERQSKRLGRLVAWALVPPLGMAGQIEDALALLGRWQAPSKRWGEALPFVAHSQRAFRAYVLWLAGRLIEAVAYCDRERDALRETGEVGGASVLEPACCAALIDMGRVVTAAASLREALVLLEELDLPMFATWSLAFLALALALAGDTAGAREAFERAKATRPEQVCVMDPELGTAEVWLTVAEGDLPTARELSLALAAEHEENGRIPAAARALHDVARLGEPTRVTDRLATLVKLTDAPVVAVKAAHAHALAASEAPALTAVGNRFEELGCLLWAAEARVAAARVFAASGRTSSARGSSARAAALLARCEGASTPGLADATAAASLTRRERDIAQLAARGLSNREIAERLVVSVRTVESHLAHAYTKLAVNKREDLAQVLLTPP